MSVAAANFAASGNVTGWARVEMEMATAGVGRLIDARGGGG
jgi:hypothetical protein